MPHLHELVAQSQQLEQILRTLPQRPQVERVSTAATIDTIEQRIQWLDFQLSNAPEADLSEEQSWQLWRERVELMKINATLIEQASVDCQLHFNRVFLRTLVKRLSSTTALAAPPGA